MNIVAHHHRSSELLSSKISHFLEEFHVSKILRSCNAYKVRLHYFVWVEKPSAN